MAFISWQNLLGVKQGQVLSNISGCSIFLYFHFSTWSTDFWQAWTSLSFWLAPQSLCIEKMFICLIYSPCLCTILCIKSYFNIVINIHNWRRKMQYHIHPSYKHPKLMLIKVTWKNAISWNIYCKHAVSGETSVQVKDKLILNWMVLYAPFISLHLWYINYS